MNPNAIHRVAIAAAVSAVVFAVALSAGRRCHQSTPPVAPIAVDMAINEERAAAEMARAEALAARAEADAQRAEAEVERAATQAGMAAEEAEAAETLNREEELNKVRQAAKDFVKSVAPDAKSDGVFLLPLYQDSLFIAGVDTQSPDGKRRTIDLLVRRYVRKGTSSYWRAESLDGGQNTVVKMRK